jgi:glycosyltransferase involved in cell wall biosynthesis
LISQLLDRRQVLWVNTIGTRTPHLDLATISRGLEKLGHWASPNQSCLPPNLKVINPRMWPWFGSTWSRRVNRFLLLRQLTPHLRLLPTPPTAVTTLPLVADLIGKLPVHSWVYYCVDDFGAWPGLDQITLRRMEQDLVQKADSIVAVSDVLVEKLARSGRTAHLLTHGVDLRHWQTENPAPKVLTKLEALEHPLIVFWGLVDSRIDAGMVRRLDERLSQGTILLIGPKGDPDPALFTSRHLVHLGPVSYEELPHLAHLAAVLIMPYADLPVTRAIQPLKLKEYLATGKPVVVRDLPATRSWADCLDLADSPESFAQAVVRRLQEGLSLEQKESRLRLEEEDWASKARDFERWVEGEEAHAFCRP